MLLEFRVKNFRSWRASQTLSLVASEDDQDALPGNTVPVPAAGLERLRALKAVAVYGANASGKSNLLHALNFLRSFVLNSARLLGPRQATGVVRFGAPGRADTAPSEFETAFAHNHVYYRFRVALTPERVTEETLEAHPEGARELWYRRSWDPASGGYRYEQTEGSGFVRDPKQEEFTRPNALFLSTAVQLNNPQLQPVVDWFRDRLAFGLGGRVRLGSTPRLMDTATCLEGGGSLANRLQSLMKHADFGIAKARSWTEEEEIEIEDEEAPGQHQTRVLQRTHVAFRHAGPQGGEFELPLEEESAGTQRFFSLAGPWLQSLDRGVTLCLDEFDTSLHPFMTQALLELVFDPAHNATGSQVLFTTHNPLLLDPTLLRRDQVWFVDKDMEGGSFLYPLTDYKPRKDEPWLRSYLADRYGALPFIPGGLLPKEPTDEAE